MGIVALVVELVEVPTLAGRIAHGPITINKGLRVASRQIAGALEAVHERAATSDHNVEPRNIKVRHDGTVEDPFFRIRRCRST